MSLDFNQWGSAPQKREEVDFDDVNARALGSLQSILEHFLPGGKAVGREYHCADLSGGPGDSCKTNIDTGLGSDFASGQGWGDPVDLVAQIFDVKNLEGAKILMRELGMTSNTPKTARPVIEREAPEVRYARGKESSLQLWMKGTSCPHTHPYLTSKGVWASGDVRLLQDENMILIPLYDKSGTFWSIQRIYPDGAKRLVKDSRLMGNFFTFPGKKDVIYIAEGYSTAASIATATGNMTVMCVSAGNMTNVAQAVAELYPSKKIVLAADFDDKGDGQNPGVEAAEKAKAAIGRGEVIAPPGGVKQDWNDYAQKFGLEAVKKELSVAPTTVDITAWGIGAYQGEPKETDWVVKNILPRGKPAIISAMGDTGKGYLTLDLGIKVAKGPATGVNLNAKSGWFGNEIACKGAVAIFSAEDDFDEIHRRLHNIDPSLSGRSDLKMYIIPMPDACGPQRLLIDGKDGVEAGPWFHEVMDQLMEIDDLALINFDPLASFAGADINADPQAGQYMMGLLAHMANRTNASVLVAHHMNKAQHEITTPEQARLATRGTTALVDGVRVAINLWGCGETEGHMVCEQLGVGYQRNRVVKGAVTKANGPADREVKVFVRDDNGLLIVRDTDLTKIRLPETAVLDVLVEDVARAAADGRPFTVSGTTGITSRKEELQITVREESDYKIKGDIEKLLKQGRIVKATHGRSVAKWLDIPGGNFALGLEVDFVAGAPKANRRV